MNPTHRVNVVNPLPWVLRHYEKELSETLERVGWRLNLVSQRPVERLGRLEMLCHALVNAIIGAGAGSIQIWPSSGLLEPLLWSLFSRRASAIIFHDPQPLRTQRGFGKVSRYLALRFHSSKIVLIVHGAKAERELRKAFPSARILVVGHPILSEPRTLDIATVRHRVLVAGQYKPERDLDLLGRVGRALHGQGLTGRIVGRGWPAIDGWRVIDRFVTETELDNELAAAGVVLLPYRNYFQSNIAVRSVEIGTPVVGENTEFLVDLVGMGSHIYAHSATTEEIVASLLSAVLPSKGDCHIRDYQARIDSQWKAVLAEIFLGAV